MRATAAAWEAAQEQVAGAVVSDPDVVLYFAYLASNRANALVQRVVSDLCDLVVAVEGWKHEQPSVADPSALRRMLDDVISRGAPTSEDLARVDAEAARYIAKQLVPAVTKGGRSQLRGQEALGAYGTAMAASARSWRRMTQAVDAFRADRSVGDAVTTAAATRAPLRALRTTADLLDPARLTDFTVQLAAAKSAVAASGRPVDLRTRLRVGNGTFPQGASVSGTFSGGVVTAVTTTPAPLLLGVRSGDRVSCGAGTAVVTSVGSTSFSLGDSTLTAVDQLLVESAPYLAWDTARSAVAPLVSGLPAGADLRRDIQALEGDRSSARISAVISRVISLVQVLGTPTTAAAAAAARCGISATPPPGGTVTDLLRAFAPTIRASTRQAGDSIVAMLEDRGFDRAVDGLYRGAVTEVVTAPVHEASRAAYVMGLATTVGLYTGGAGELG